MSIRKEYERSILAATAFVIAGLAGCELSAPDGPPITISPTSATLNVGESQRFVASAGQGYTEGTYGWSLSDPQIGSLDVKSGDRVVYTCAVPGTQWITVTFLGNTSSPGANGQPSEFSATAVVVSTNVSALAVQITPVLANLTLFGTQSFTASGGDGNYSWSLSNPNIGTLSANTGSQVMYTATVTPTSATGGIIMCK